MKSKKLLALILSAIMVLCLTPAISSAGTVTNEAGSELTVSIADKINSGETEEFTVSTKKGTDNGTMVKGIFDFSSAEDVIESLQYYETSPGMEGWYEFSGNTFGPESGFPLMDATSKFRVKFKDGTSGSFPYTVKIVRVNDGQELLVNKGSVTVVGNPTVEINAPEEFKVGEATEFSIGTTAGNKAGTMVVGKADFTGNAAIEKIEYYEAADNSWHEFKDGDGNFGPADGFPLGDYTGENASKFRVTFKSAGTFALKVSIAEAGNTENVLASSEAEIKVVGEVTEPTTPTEPENPTESVTPTNPNGDNQASADNQAVETGDESNIMVPALIAIASLAAIGALIVTRRRHS